MAGLSSVSHAPSLPSISLYLQALVGRRCQIRHPRVDPTRRGWIWCAVAVPVYSWLSAVASTGPRPGSAGATRPYARLGHVRHVRLHLVCRWILIKPIDSSSTLGIRGQGVEHRFEDKSLSPRLLHTQCTFSHPIFSYL